MTEKIIDIKKAAGRAVLFMESGEKLTVPLPLLRERPLRAGDSIDPAEYRAFLERRAYPHALDRAVQRLALRGHSRAEVVKKLEEAGYPPSAVRQATDKLLSEELLDDRAFAREWVESRSRRYGRGRIERELRAKGISPDDAQPALEMLDEEEQIKQAARTAGKFLSRTQGDMDLQLYRRTLAMLARHGYGPETAKKALRRIAEGLDEDE